MMRLLRRAADELGKTVVVVLHDINFASCYSDHIVAMRDGRVAAQGAPEEIMESGIIRSIFGIDVSIFREETGIYALYYR
jgi:iron complex transport system ATP-binding protein